MKTKRKEFLEIKEKRNCLLNLIERNKADEMYKTDAINNYSAKINLPFFALRTSNNPNNIA